MWKVKRECGNETTLLITANSEKELARTAPIGLWCNGLKNKSPAKTTGLNGRTLNSQYDDPLCTAAIHLPPL